MFFFSNSNISQSRNSVKFASPVRYSANSDTVDATIQPTCNGNGNGNGNINLSNEASKATSDALTLRSVASTFPFVEPGDSNISVNGVTTYDPSSQVEDKWKTSGTEPTNGLQSCGNGQFSQNYSSNNGNLKRYSDNDHYLRKSASVQIIAHEPSRCEGCFDGRLPLLLIVVFIALVLFLLCIGVILDAEGNNFPSTTKLLIILLMQCFLAKISRKVLQKCIRQQVNKLIFCQAFS